MLNPRVPLWVSR